MHTHIYILLSTMPPSTMPSGYFQSSESITAPLVTLIISQHRNEVHVVDHDSVRTVKNEVRRKNRRRQDERTS